VHAGSREDFQVIHRNSWNRDRFPDLAHRIKVSN
jgi:hypothetical protein